ncbi:hypothetical protein NBO_67g0014 [Nosema bombycis CQ1]|nr:hypothetical protein NBO_67g0014 [Nosema bombycis CQ1]|eukprot:EOB13539.1 hypothetical protein NBO_67g0014 [Nosema bombycis CQ1]
MKDFDYESFKSKFDELMKDEKYKKLMNDLPNMQKKKEEMINPDHESREL